MPGSRFFTLVFPFILIMVDNKDPYYVLGLSFKDSPTAP